MANETPMSPAAWVPGIEVLDKADRVYQDLRSLDLAPLSDWLARVLETRGTQAADDLDLFSDALFDLSQLAEEVRFGAGVGALYLLGFEAEIDSAVPDEDSVVGRAGVPTSVMALLVSYMRPNPAPSSLLLDPGQAIAGHRVLAGWWAAQVFDAALIRGMSAMDRLAVLLYSADGGVPVPNKHGEITLPAFRKSWLNRIHRWDETADWAALVGILNHPVFKFIKRYRDGFVHQRREPVQLHGGHNRASSGGAGRSPSTTAGISAGMHLAMVRGYFDLILRPSTDLVSKLLQSTDWAHPPASSASGP